MTDIVAAEFRHFDDGRFDIVKRGFGSNALLDCCKMLWEYSLNPPFRHSLGVMENVL